MQEIESVVDSMIADRVLEDSWRSDRTRAEFDGSEFVRKSRFDRIAMDSPISYFLRAWDSLKGDVLRCAFAAFLTVRPEHDMM